MPVVIEGENAPHDDFPPLGPYPRYVLSHPWGKDRVMPCAPCQLCQRFTLTCMLHPSRGHASRGVRGQGQPRDRSGTGTGKQLSDPSPRHNGLPVRAVPNPAPARCWRWVDGSNIRTAADLLPARSMHGHWGVVAEPNRLRETPPHSKPNTVLDIFNPLQALLLTPAVV